MKRSLSVLFGLVFLCVGVTRAEEKTPTDAREVIRRAVEAQGGTEAFQSVKCAWGRAKGIWFTKDLELPFQLRFWSGNGKGKNVFIYDAGYTKLYQVKVWNAENSWFLTNDTLQEVPRARGADAESMSSQEGPFAILTAVLDNSEVTLELLDGDAATVGVKVTENGGNEVQMFFDRRTGLRTREVRRKRDEDGREAEMEEQFSDYKECQGIKWPMKERILKDGKPVMECEIVAFHPAPTLRDELFSCPDPADYKAPETWTQPFALGSQALSLGAVDEAVDSLEQFLCESPRSPLAAEAAYKLACAHVLAHHDAEAREAFERLIRNHTGSMWAALAVQSHLTAKQVADLAEKFRREGCAKGDASCLEIGSGLYKFYLDHYAGQRRSAKSKAEIIYCIACCQRRLGRQAIFEQAMQMVLREGSGKWSKLAMFWLGETKDFAGRMDDLMHLEAGDGEQYQAFLDLSDDFLGLPVRKPSDWPVAATVDRTGTDTETASVNEEDRVKCLYYRARCFDYLDRKAEALAGYRALVKEHADSEWASRCRLWLAVDRLREVNRSPAVEMWTDFVHLFAATADRVESEGKEQGGLMVDSAND